jgi:multidrug efflux pump subunit AcrB
MARSLQHAAIACALLALGCSRESSRAAAPDKGRERDAGPPPPPEEVIVVAEPGGLDAAGAEQEVTAPLEDALGRVRAIATMRSLSTAGRVSITCRLARGADGAGAARDIADALRGARAPAGMAPPSLTRRSSATERLRWTATSSTADWTVMAGVRDDLMRPALERVSGVTGVAVCGGGGAPLVRVRIDPDRLDATGLDLAAVRAALLRASGSSGFRSLDEIAAAPVDVPGNPGAAASLRDLATVEEGVDEPTCLARTATAAAALSIDVAIDPSAGAESRVRDQMAAIGRQLPAGFRVTELPPGPGLELRFEAPAGTDLASLDRIAAAKTQELGAMHGVAAVLVESGAPTGSIEPDLAGIRALVAVDGGAAPAVVTAASTAAGVGVRVTSGPLAELRIRLRGAEPDILERAAQEIAGAALKVPGVAAAGVLGAGRLPRIDVRPDMSHTAGTGLGRDDIVAAGRAAFEGAAAGQLARGGRRIPIRIQLGASRPGLEVLDRVKLRTATGALVPLSSVAAVVLTDGPAAVLHIDRQRAVELWVQPATGAERSGVLAGVRSAVGRLVPAGVELTWPEAPAPAMKPPAGQKPRQER